MDLIDRHIINSLQGGIDVSERPFVAAANSIGISEDELLSRLSRLLDDGTLTRFGPMYDAEKIGGAFSLAALRVPENDFARVTEIVNSFAEVAHNYERNHDFNMWYVIATDDQDQVAEVNRKIEEKTGLKVYNMPKLEEYFIGLHLSI
jgi:DNA-binding Lrp family transcriptional regulator